MLYNTSANNKEIAEAIQEMWRKKLGVEVDIVNEEWKVYIDSQHTHNYQTQRAGWIGRTTRIPTCSLEIWESGNGNNDTLWSNPEYDRLLHEALCGPMMTSPGMRFTRRWMQSSSTNAR